MATRSKLSAGAYEPELTDKAQHYISRYTACWRFLDAVRVRYPEVLDDLDRFPYTPEDIAVAAAPARALLEGKDSNSAKQALDWLREWARRNRLGADLILKVAARTICHWHSDPASRLAHQWAFPDTNWFVPETALDANLARSVYGRSRLMDRPVRKSCRKDGYADSRPPALGPSD